MKEINPPRKERMGVTTRDLRHALLEIKDLT